MARQGRHCVIRFFLSVCRTTRPWRDSRAVRASRRMPQERAYLVRCFRAEDVFELAGLLFDFAFTVHGEAVGEEALREAMATDDANSAFAAPAGEFNDLTAIAERRGGGLERIMTGIDEGLVMMGFGRMRAGGDQSERNHFFDRDADGQRAMDFHVFELGDLVIFREGPELFEDFVELLVVGHGENFAGCDFAVMQFDAAVGKAGDDRIVRDHHDGSALLVQLTEQAQDDFFIDSVEVAGGLVGENDFGIVDEGASNADALLLSARELRRRVMGAVFEADAVEGVEGFLLVGHAVKILRQHDVLNGGEIGNQMKLLKDEADLVSTNAIQLATRNGGDVQIVEPDFTGAGTVEASD